MATNSDPVFLITGASSGIGAATARHAAEAGYRLVLAARSTDKIDALAEELGGDERAIAVTCDVTEWDQQQALVKAALDAYGRVDVAFANAGFGAPRGFQESDVDHWKEMVLTNVYGAALTIRATLDALKDTQGPHAAHRARWPAAARSSARSTPPPSGRSPAWASRCARSSTTAACA